jgi:uncharacterized protein
MKYIKRFIETPLEQFIDDTSINKNVLLVEGARQVGKSTLTNHVLQSCKKQVISLNLEKEPRIRSLIDTAQDFKDFSAILQDHLQFHPDSDMVLFIDESQESLKLGSFVRFMKEDWVKTTVILSGSTLSRLFKQEVRFPVGRIDRLTVTPFSFSEYLAAIGEGHLVEFVNNPENVTQSRHENLLKLYDMYLTVGGLPAVIADYIDNKQWQIRREEMVADLEQDFIRIFGEDTFPIVKSCMKSVAMFVGNPSKNTTVIENPGSKINMKINEVFSRLESWHLVLLCPQNGISPEQSYGYFPKRYLYDTGVLRHLRETSVPSLGLLDKTNFRTRTGLGGIIENQIAIDLTRNGKNIFGWKKSSSGTEIDFIIQELGTAWPIECKASSSLKNSSLRGPLDYLNYYKVKYGFIVSSAPYERRPFRDGYHVVNIPLYSSEYIREIIKNIS